MRLRTGLAALYWLARLTEVGAVAIYREHARASRQEAVRAFLERLAWDEATHGETIRALARTGNPSPLVERLARAMARGLGWLTALGGSRLALRMDRGLEVAGIILYRAILRRLPGDARRTRQELEAVLRCEEEHLEGLSALLAQKEPRDGA